MTITVGAGGSAGVVGAEPTNGGNTSFGTYVIAKGGGAKGGGNSSNAQPQVQQSSSMKGV